MDNHGITILYHPHQCRPCTSRDYRAKFGKGGIINIVSSIDVHILKMYLSATKKNMFKYTDACADPGIFVSCGEVGSRSI